MESISKIDKQIFDIDKKIYRHINDLNESNRGIISQDILSTLRNFVEHIMLKILSNGQDIDDSYENICKAINYSKTKSEFKDLYRLHNYLKISTSHYTLDEQNSERLMLKYYEYLLKVQKYVFCKFSMKLLNNIEKFQLEIDKELLEYYEKIANKINYYSQRGNLNSDKYYIQKIKPFYINQQIYYEITFNSANDNESKFNRVIAFTKLEITNFYSVKLSFQKENIEIFDKIMPILIITNWEVSIRDCEYRNFTYLITGNYTSTGYREKNSLCLYLTKSGINLTELINFSDIEFQKIKREIARHSKTVIFFKILDICRYLIKRDSPGSNILRYLLYHMNNKVIKLQRLNIQNRKLSDLYISYGCIPFDSMPFSSSLIGHNPQIIDLFFCFKSTKRQHELLAKLIKNNTEINGKLFTDLNEIPRFDNIETLVNKYNNILYDKHVEERKLVIDKNHIFINSYKSCTKEIIKELLSLSKIEIRNHSNSVQSWLKTTGYEIDCKEKEKALINLFATSCVALVYGSAGTGKSTLINHICHFYANKNILLLAQTNPAINNLKRKVTASSNCTFITITKFLSNRNTLTQYDLLIIDECSTVSNSDMKKIINKANYKALILVGDPYQISSIRFGNWFSIAYKVVPKKSIYELTEPFRSSNKYLITLWERVRKMDDTILEILTRQNYTTSLNNTIFSDTNNDGIILCLNYNGLYGINNINRLLQENNPNKSFKWGIQQFKINDPILFNDTNRFSPVIYNNMKGRINSIEMLDEGVYNERIQFDIELDKVINEIDEFGQDFEYIGDTPNGNSIVRFSVYKAQNSDDDSVESSNTIIPFQIAYAISIHKAQGLEYNSVKIVITDEVEEQITHNIFYTAITRAKEQLLIYWSPEVCKRVLDNIKPKDIGKDLSLLKIID